MNTIQRSIEVEASPTEAFSRWTQFERFPEFMPDMQQVRRLDDRHMHWRAQIGGRTEEWDAEITEMIPNRVVGWRSTSGAENSGTVYFEPTGRGGTRLDVRLNYQPHSFIERMGSALGLVAQRVDEDLRRFKSLIEQRTPTTSSGSAHPPEMNRPPGM